MLKNNSLTDHVNGENGQQQQRLLRLTNIYQISKQRT